MAAHDRDGLPFFSAYLHVVGNLPRYLSLGPSYAYVECAYCPNNSLGQLRLFSLCLKLHLTPVQHRLNATSNCYTPSYRFPWTLIATNTSLESLHGRFVPNFFSASLFSNTHVRYPVRIPGPCLFRIWYNSPLCSLPRCVEG